MKKVILLLLVFAAPAFGQVIADELRIQQGANPPVGYQMRTYGAPPAGNAPYILGFDGSIARPAQFLLGNGLSWTGGTGLTVGNLPISSTSGLQAALDGKQPASPFLDELATIGTMNPDEAIRTNSTGDFVAESRASYRSWLGITTSDVGGLATVASTGAYSDLSGRPSALSAFTNDTGFITASALSPYVTSASLSGTLASYATTSSVSTGLAGKFDVPTGTTAQYLQGNGTLATFPTNLSAFTNGPGYVTQAGARSAISLTTIGTGGAATYNSGTGVLNIPNYAPGTGTVTSVGVTSSNLTVTGSPVTTSGSIAISLPATGTAGTYSSVTTDAQGRVTAGTNWVFAGGNGQQLSRTIQTTAAAANGWQISSTRPAFVSYSGTIQSTSALAGGAAGALLLEVAATNSATAGDWKEIARTADGQTNGLIIGLGLNMVGGGCISGLVPPGYFVRVRAVNTTGTSTFTYNSGQEVQM